MKRAVQSPCAPVSPEGIRIQCAGRSVGRDRPHRGFTTGPRAPAHFAGQIRLLAGEARTTYGVVGVKCWIFKGEVIEDRFGRTYSTGPGA